MFPACAGMNRPQPPRLPTPAGVPRLRGDEPSPQVRSQPIVIPRNTRKARRHSPPNSRPWIRGNLENTTANTRTKVRVASGPTSPPPPLGTIEPAPEGNGQTVGNGMRSKAVAHRSMVKPQARRTPTTQPANEHRFRVGTQSRHRAGGTSCGLRQRSPRLAVVKDREDVLRLCFKLLSSVCWVPPPRAHQRQAAIRDNVARLTPRNR